MDSDVLVAIVTTLGTVVAAYLAARSGKGPFRKVEDSAVWKERAELAEAKAGAWEAKHSAEVDAHTRTKAELAEEARKRQFAELEADTADRRLNDLYARLRADGRVVERKDQPRAGE